MSKTTVAKFKIGQVIRHRIYAVRGVVFDVDAEFDSRERSHEMLLIEGQQRKDQPFYYLFAQHEQSPYIAYVSEHNLQADASDEPVRHPLLDNLFDRDEQGCYRWRRSLLN